MALLEEGERRFRYPVGLELPQDLRVLLQALHVLGGSYERDEKAALLQVRGRGAGPLRGRLDLGSNATLLRFSIGICTVLGGELELDGSPQLRRRPIGPLCALVQDLGAHFSFSQMPGHLPLHFRAPGLRSRGTWGTPIVVDPSAGTQGASGLLLGLAALGRGAHLHCPSAKGDTHPYLLLTGEALEVMGYPACRSEAGTLVLPSRSPRPQPGGRPPAGGDIHVPRDPSALAFALVVAALQSRECFFPGPLLGVSHPDLRILEDLREMGHECEATPEGLRFRGRGAGAGDLCIQDLDLRPDSFPPLSLLCVFREGVHVLGDAPRLRIKESDRIGTLAQGFRSLGIEVQEREGGLRIRGGWTPKGEGPKELDPRGDHRMAMVFLLLSRLGGLHTRVLGESCVEKSWPSFPRFLKEVGVGDGRTED